MRSEQTSGPVVVITGANGGIGRATALRFAAAGYQLVLADYVEDAAVEARDVVAAEYPETSVLTVACDVTSESSVASAAATIREWAGRVDAVALVAGVLQDAAPVDGQNVEVWNRMFDTNARGVFLCSKHFARLIPDHSGGSITAIASWSGRLGSPFFSAYCASKAAVIVFMQSLAHELAERGIRANSVSPGNIDTNMHRMAIQEEADARGVSFAEVRDIEWGKIPLKVAGPPAAVADAVVFLASNNASYITGESLDVNGGVHMR